VVDDPGAERRHPQLVAQLGVGRAEVVEDLEGERERVLLGHVEAPARTGRSRTTSASSSAVRRYVWAATSRSVGPFARL
jgi:hypothetical protein